MSKTSTPERERLAQLCDDMAAGYVYHDCPCEGEADWKTIAAIVRESRETAAVVGWRSMDSAPTTRKWVLVYVAPFVYVARRTSRRVDAGEYPFWESCDRDPLCEPTRWMPLPTPPSPDSAVEAPTTSAPDVEAAWTDVAGELVALANGGGGAAPRLAARRLRAAVEASIAASEIRLSEGGSR